MIKWTPNARQAAQDASRDMDGDMFDHAIAEAERLAEAEGSTVVDIDLWRQALDAELQETREAQQG
jgi:hypothetical protein